MKKIKTPYTAIHMPQRLSMRLSMKLSLVFFYALEYYSRAVSAVFYHEVLCVF